MIFSMYVLFCFFFLMRKWKTIGKWLEWSRFCLQTVFSVDSFCYPLTWLSCLGNFSWAVSVETNSLIWIYPYFAILYFNSEADIVTDWYQTSWLPNPNWSVVSNTLFSDWIYSPPLAGLEMNSLILDCTDLLASPCGWRTYLCILWIMCSRINLIGELKGFIWKTTIWQFSISEVKS